MAIHSLYLIFVSYKIYMMKAVLFAAGLGTRLGEITKQKPKALVEVQHRPMLYRVMDRIRQAGIKDFVVNVHAFADMVEVALDEYVRLYPDVKVQISDERDFLLETGGGLKKMANMLQDGPFLVHNVDVLSNIDLSAFVSASSKQDALACLAVRKIESDRYFLFNKNFELCGWENVKLGQQKISRNEPGLQAYGFMGIHMINPAIFSLIEEDGAFSITDVYLRLAREHKIFAIDCSSAQWMDIGSVEQLAKAEEIMI